MNLDDAVVVAMAAYTENEWRTSESAMRAALAAATPLIQAEALEQAATIAAGLRAENERLREALKPFAAAADWDWSITIWKDEPRQNAQVLWHNAKQEGITLADFDTASALLAKKETDHGDW